MTACATDGCEREGRGKSGVCRPCYERLPHVQEYRRRYTAANRERKNADRAARRAADPDAVRAYNRRYYAEHRDAEAERCKRWREANAERHAANGKRWRQGNPVKARQAWAAKNARRYAQIRATRQGPVDYAAVVERHGMWCYLCETDILSLTDLHLDHVVPLSKGGEHAESNLRPTHASCNQRKGARPHAASV